MLMALQGAFDEVQELLPLHQKQLKKGLARIASGVRFTVSVVRNVYGIEKKRERD